MKTLTASILALASLSTVYAAEPEISETALVQLSIPEEITLVLTDKPMSAGGECKAVCALPAFLD